MFDKILFDIFVMNAVDNRPVLASELLLVSYNIGAIRLRLDMEWNGFDCLVHYCIISIANALEILQSCPEVLICVCVFEMCDFRNPL